MIKLFHVVLMKPDLSGAKLKLTHSYLTQIQTKILNSTHFLWVETDAFETLPVFSSLKPSNDPHAKLCDD